MPEPLAPALAALRPLLLDQERLVRAVAGGRRKGEPPRWRRVDLRPVDLRDGRHLQVVALDERQAHTSNAAYGLPADSAVDELLAEPFGSWHVETTESTVQLRVTKRGEAQVHRTVADREAPAERVHDRAKPRLLDPAEPFLRELGVTDADGRVKPSRQGKLTQVEEFLRALDAVLDPALQQGRLPHRPVRVVDLGCGNAYLTLATYRFLTSTKGLPVELTGVDVKAQAHAHDSEVVARLGWSAHVRFVEGTILDAPVEGADIALALHACDTATDEALARAVRWQSPVVLAAPCCHHDVQRQLALAASPAPPPYALLTRQGILRERFADVLTDALRAALLRLLGYRVEVIEFVGSRHTPRNTLLRAVRTGASPSRENVDEYVALATAWGVTPRLQVLLADQLAGVLA